MHRSTVLLVAFAVACAHVPSSSDYANVLREARKYRFADLPVLPASAPIDRFHVDSYGRKPPDALLRAAHATNLTTRDLAAALALARIPMIGEDQMVSARHGAISFSWPVFDAGIKQALVFSCRRIVTNEPGDEFYDHVCADESAYVLRRDGSGWVVVDSFTVHID